MPTVTPTVRLQIALVVALFLGSLAVIAVTAVSAASLARPDAATRDRLSAAAARLAAAAAPLLAAPPNGRARDLDDRLRAATTAVLADVPGAEGGYFLGGDGDRFSGYAFPTTPHGDVPPLPRNEPPPLEAPYIRLLARQSLVEDPGRPLVQEYAVGPSRVLVCVEPVGPDRPAPAAAWVMVRMTGPAQLEQRVGHYQLSLALALGGIALALGLTVNLGRTLKRQRQDQDRLREDLRRAEHLAAVGRLLAGVAHEVRNPLAAIRSTVQLWQRLPETARDADSLAAVIRAVDRINDTVSRLLYFARADAGDRRPVAVNDLLAETLKLIEAQAAGQGVTLETDLAADLPAVSASADALRQVFLNLATNALQAMPAGGRLRCTSRTNADRRTVVVRFADTGPGVSADARPHLFEPFFTTRPAGTGLGLALCREIIDRHGGRIDLDAGAGPGATFRVELPAGGEP